MCFQEGLRVVFLKGGGAHVECAERGIRHGDTALDDLLDKREEAVITQVRCTVGELTL